MKPNGLFGGLYTGYNVHFSNNIVLGIDTDINVANINGNDDFWDFYFFGSPGKIQLPFSAKMTWNGAARARLGYAFERFLPYIAGGVSFGGYKFNITTPALDEDIVIASQSSTRTGWNIGAGIEYAATDRTTLRGEYRYTDFGRKSFGADFGIPLETSGSLDLKTHDIRFGIAYKF